MEDSNSASSKVQARWVQAFRIKGDVPVQLNEPAVSLSEGSKLKIETGKLQW